MFCRTLKIKTPFFLISFISKFRIEKKTQLYHLTGKNKHTSCYKIPNKVSYNNSFSTLNKLTRTGLSSQVSTIKFYYSPIQEAP